MKKRQQKYSMFNRIFLLLYVPLSIALAVYFLFTTRLSSCALSLLSLLYCLLPYWAERLTKFKPEQLLYAVYLSFGLLFYTGHVVLRLERWIPGYSLFCQLLLSACFVLIGLLLSARRARMLTKRLRHCLCSGLAISGGVILIILDAVISFAVSMPITAEYIVAECIVCVLASVLLPFIPLHTERRKPAAIMQQAIDDFFVLNTKPSTIRITSIHPT